MKGARRVSPWRPTKVVVLDVEDPVPTISATEAGGATFGQALVLLRRNGRPVRLARLSLDRSFDTRLAKEVGETRAAAAERAAEPGDDLLPPATVVVCSTFERLDALLLCVQALSALTYPLYDILVVDNRPVAAVEEHQALRTACAKVRVIHEPTVGLSRARNRALRECTTEIVAFTDDDVVPRHDWLRWLVGAIVADSKVGCATGMLLPNDLLSEAQELFEEFYGGFNRSLEGRVYGRPGVIEHPLYPYAVGQFGTGASMAFRTAALHQIGGFDPALGAGTRAKGGEDLAAFVDVLTVGWCLAVEPAAVALHTHRASRDELLQRVRSYGTGLTAMLTALVIQDWRQAPRMLALAPRALRAIAVSRSGTINRRTLTRHVPPALYVNQALGMALGPVAYLRSRWALTRH